MPWLPGKRSFLASRLSANEFASAVPAKNSPAVRGGPPSPGRTQDSDKEEPQPGPPALNSAKKGEERNDDEAPGSSRRGSARPPALRAGRRHKETGPENSRGDDRGSPTVSAPPHLEQEEGTETPARRTAEETTKAHQWQRRSPEQDSGKGAAATARPSQQKEQWVPATGGKASKDGKNTKKLLPVWSRRGPRNTAAASPPGDSRTAEMTRRKCAFCPYDEPCAIMYISEEQNLTVHQNCLLFSSGFVESAEENPEDLDKRFDVASVRSEIKRGRRLHCSYCQKRGATIGCEVGTCRKSYHYFCALRDGASMETNEDQGCYRLFCSNHKAKRSCVDDEDSEKSPFIPKSSSTTSRMVTPVMAVMTRRKCAFCPDDEPCAIMYISEEQKFAVHENCLLFSSRFVELAEQNPEDLDKRFDLESVMSEIRSRLLCDGCQKRGATIGCKIDTCDSNFHYFCALRDGASMEKDEEQGCYRLCCSNHIPAKRSCVDDEDSENEMSLFVPETSSTTTRMNDETVGEENMELVSENHDQPKERIEFLKKCKQAGVLNEIFEKMLNTLHLAQEKLMDDNTSEAEYEETVALLFDCGLFENIRKAALSGTEGKIEELTNTRNRLDAEIERLKVLKEFSGSEDNTSSIISA